jgi:hypothetical protein
MGTTFKNAKYSLTDTDNETVYTCPAATTAIVFGCQVANVHASDSATIQVSWTDDSDSDAETELLENATVITGQAIQAIAGKLVLEAGDTLKAKASAGNVLKISAAILEIT